MDSKNIIWIQLPKQYISDPNINFKFQSSIGFGMSQAQRDSAVIEIVEWCETNFGESADDGKYWYALSQSDPRPGFDSAARVNMYKENLQVYSHTMDAWFSMPRDVVEMQFCSSDESFAKAFKEKWNVRVI